MGVPGAIAENTDGTVNIYINTLYCREKQTRALRHELRHLAKNHFHAENMTVFEKELEADLDDNSCIFAKDFSWVELQENRNFDTILGRDMYRYIDERIAGTSISGHSIHFNFNQEYTIEEAEKYIAMLLAMEKAIVSHRNEKLTHRQREKGYST